MTQDHTQWNKQIGSSRPRGLSKVIHKTEWTRAEICIKIKPNLSVLFPNFYLFLSYFFCRFIFALFIEGRLVFVIIVVICLFLSSPEDILIDF